MTTSTTNAGLRRITTQSRQAFQARAMSPVKALRLALARAADSLFDLPLAVHDCAQDRVEHAALVGALDAGDLLILLEGPERSRGVLAVDAAALAGLVESQTVGRVLRGAPRARIATATDAALIAPLIDGCLAGFADYLSAEGGAGWAAGYHCGDKAETVQWLGLTLDAQEYHRFVFTVDLDAGAKQGRMTLALPERAAEAPPPRPEVEAAGEEAGDARLAEQVLGVEARLEAVICRLLMPYSALRGLKAGDRLSLPADALGALRLEAAGALVAEKGRLGQVEGYRAVRLAGGADTVADWQAHEAEGAATGGAIAAAAEEPVPPPEPAPLAPSAAVAEAGFADLPDLGDLGDLGDLLDLDGPARGADGGIDALPGLADLDLAPLDEDLPPLVQSV